MSYTEVKPIWMERLWGGFCGWAL